MPELHESECYYQIIVAISALVLILVLIYPIMNEMTVHIYTGIQKQKEKNKTKQMSDYVVDKKRLVDG